MYTFATAGMRGFVREGVEKEAFECGKTAEISGHTGSTAGIWAVDAGMCGREDNVGVPARRSASRNYVRIKIFPPGRWADA
jgi:hypothetical protein